MKVDYATLIVFGITALFSQCVTAQSWTRDEVGERQEQHVLHWGQRGEHHSNNGWSDYGRLRLTLKNAEQLTLTQANGELRATVFRRNAGAVVYEALVVPKIVLLYRDKQKPKCTAERIESLGIQAETALFFLSQAFPFGPTSITQSEEREVTGAPTELRFLQGILRIRSPWKVKVTVTPAQSSDAAVAFDIKSSGKSLVSGEWRGPDGTSTAEDSELLQNWNRCWYGTKDANGVQDRARDEQLRSSRTLGELRALKN